MEQMVGCIDHDHKTGKIRGLLCGFCNKAIGLLKENINILRNAIHYLEKKDEIIAEDYQI